MMTDNITLIEGPIKNKIFKLALPLMGASFFNTAYTLTDLFWIGTINTKAVAAAGLSGLFWWLSSSLMLICQVGLAVTISQNYGRGDIKAVKEYINSGYKLNFLISLVFCSILFFFSRGLLSFFSIKDLQTYEYAIIYLSALSVGIFINFTNFMFAVTFNATGKSKITFIITAIGVVANIILDPIFIKVFDLGLLGAAIATDLGVFIVFLLYLFLAKRMDALYRNVNFRERADWKKAWEIFKLGLPPAIQSAVHCMITMILNVFVNDFGYFPVAAQSIGSEIESVSWLTSDGFSTANATFIGQNFGAKKYDRVKQGYRESFKIVFSVGMFASLLLYFARYQLMGLFLREKEALELGALYLQILSFSQVFMAIDIATAGAFNGLGLTRPPSFVGICGNLLRIPLSLVLMPKFGVMGIWIAVSATSIMKGIVQVLWYKIASRKRLECLV